MKIKKFLIILVALIMVFSLVGCNSPTYMQISTYIIDTGMFLKHYGYQEWLVIAPNPNNPAWTEFIRFGAFGQVLEYASLSLDAATKEYNYFRSVGWDVINSSQIPSSVWEGLINTILIYMATYALSIGLNEVFFLVMPYQIKPTQGAIDFWPTETPTPRGQAPIGKPTYWNPYAYPAPLTPTVTLTPRPTATPKRNH